MSALPSCLNRRILIVDDNEGIHRDFRLVLKGSSRDDVELAATEAALFGEAPTIARDGFELDSAFQGQEALEMTKRALAAGQPYAMAFVDMRMPPGWDGIETIEQLWRCDPKLQIAICSAYSDCTWDDVAKRLDLRDRLLILKKPFDSIEIYQLANALTAKWRMERQAAARLASMEEAVEERTRELRQANEALHAEMQERRRLEAQLSLRQRLESIGQLAAGVAHEINTPIQYVGDSVYFLRAAFADIDALQQQYETLLGGAEAIGNERQRAALAQTQCALDIAYLREEVPRACERALAGVDRVSAIVRAMKELAHPKSDEQARADINEALRTTLLVAQSEYRYVAEVETQFGELPLVLCNIGELNQVFLNLIVNSAHAIESAGRDVSTGRIVIRTRVDGGHAEVLIQDNGCGIPEQIAPKVFDPFFTTKEVGRGTGQGLAIAHTIVVVNHGGALTFESVVEKGTGFLLRLPINGLSGGRNS